MPRVGIALLGLGRAGAFHLSSLRALVGEALLEQVYDPDGERAARVAAEHGCVSAASAEAAVSAPGVHAVIVATPTRSHFESVVLALEAGRAVLCEKPLGSDLAEVDRGYGLAAEAGLPLLVAFQRRFDPGFGAVIAAARGGDIGTLQFIRSVSRDHPLPSLEYIRTSGGLFHDCVVHDLDLVCQVAGEAPSEVFTFANSFVSEIAAVGDVDNVVISLRFPSGLLGSIDVNRKSSYGYDQRLEVFGSEGMLQVENQAQTSVRRARAAGSQHAPIDASFPTRYREAYRLELECFLECVRGKCEVPVRHAEVRENHCLASAAERSWREGIPVSPDEPL